jgi:hypothetical protein
LRLARPSVQARVLLAVVGQVAVGSREPRRALASVTGTVFAWHARRPVSAGVRLTVVGRLVAGRPGKTDRAMAQEPVAVVVVVVVATGSGSVVVGFSGVDASATVSTRRTRTSRLRGCLASDALPLAGTRAARDGSGFLRKQYTKRLPLEPDTIIVCEFYSLRQWTADGSKINTQPFIYII